jgi:hypothetical protein
MYDKEKIYDEQIYPLMDQIIKICKENNIGMFASYFLKDKDGEHDDLYCTTSLPSKECKSMVLTDLFNVAYHGYIAQKPFFMAMTVTKEATP